MANNKVNEIDGPILIIGASGFIGSNLLRYIQNYRNDVFGTSFSGSGWRLDDISSNSIIHLNKYDKSNFLDVINKINPKTIYDCSSFGAYSFEERRRINSQNYFKLN